MRLLRKPASAGVWALALLLLPFSGAGAQQVPEIAEGDRVRVQLEGRPLQEEGWGAPQQLRGTLLAHQADSLVLQIHPGITPITVALGSVRRLEISRGVPTRAQSAAGGGLRLFFAHGSSARIGGCSVDGEGVSNHRLPAQRLL